MRSWGLLAIGLDHCSAMERLGQAPFAMPYAFHAPYASLSGEDTRCHSQGFGFCGCDCVKTRHASAHFCGRGMRFALD